MAFQQLYYTSCETGLAGYGGYQFNAVTPGTSPLVMREIEERTVYEPPRWLLADPCLDEPEAYPVALSYAQSEAVPGTVIVAHVVFAGNDYSGRPGNYFAHALVTSTPGPDFGPLLPAELWGAELWRGTPVEQKDLPPLPGPLSRGDVGRPGVQAFLDARGTESLLPELLTAVFRAMTDARPVLLASEDANENIWWIAAVSYLLGEHLAPRMSFTTYSHRPGYSRHHLIGVLSEALPPDADASFQLFDLDAGRTPGGGVHPLARLLAGAGVMASEGLWQQATAFASKTEEGPDDWLGPVAAAAGLLGERLSASETDTIARWLPEAALRMPPQHVDVVLGVALTQADAALSDEQLLSLLDLARGLPSPAQVERLEGSLADRAIRHITLGEPARPVQLTSQAVTAAARAQVSDLLRTATPPTVLAALEWAAASRALPPDAELQQYGQAGLGLATPEPELTRILHGYPAVLRGLLTRLAHEPADRASRMLAGPVGALVTGDDLAPYPGLAEERLLIAVGRRRTDPMAAFDEIRDIRAGAQRAPLVDVALLNRLWPKGCPALKVVDLLDSDSMTNSADPGVRAWLVAQIEDAAARGTNREGWQKLAQAITSRPAILAMLPDDLARTATSTVAAGTKLRQAHRAVRKGDMSVFAPLYREYEAADDRARPLLRDKLVIMLVDAADLAKALRGCPSEVMAAFCQKLESWLAPSQANAGFAAHVFVALTDPGLEDQPELFAQLAAVFEQVREWHRRDRNRLAQHLEGNEEIAQQFQDWWDSRKGGRARNLIRRRFGPAEDR
jgi:GTPase-associated protein 1, N-terminal domain type 2/GTPase-associated protein 1, C-terminal domain/GTPase-associated protein 1, middle domain